jgi:type I restriction enzyme R subunit
LNDEIKAHYRKNFIQGKAFSEKLHNTIIRYQGRSVEILEVIKELIGLAEEVKKSKQRGEKLGLSEEELSFYDALGTNNSAVKILGDKVLKTIAIELTEMIRRNVTIDWTLRENIQAKLRIMVKRILRKYGYPPDKQKKATETVLEQANLLCVDWAEYPIRELTM